MVSQPTRSTEMLEFFEPSNGLIGRAIEFSMEDPSFESRQCIGRDGKDKKATLCSRSDGVIIA